MKVDMLLPYKAACSMTLGIVKDDRPGGRLLTVHEGLVHSDTTKEVVI